MVVIGAEAEVVVVGGGPAGFASAIAASRNGAQVLLIERYGFLGGTATAGLIGCMHGWGWGDGRVVQGIAHELVERLLKAGGTPGYLSYWKSHPGLAGITYVPYDPEMMKRIMLEMVEEAKIDLLLHSLAFDAIIKGQEVKGVEVQTKSCRQLVLGDIVIDATGDGDVAVAAGVPYEIGRKEDGSIQPVSLMFRMGNVDVDALLEWREQEVSKKPNLIASGGFLPEGFPVKGAFAFFYTRKNEVIILATRISGINGTNVEDLTRAEIEARKQVVEVVDFLKKNVPGFSSSYLIDTAVQVGIRETRRIIGEYVLSANDIVTGARFNDVVAKGVYPIDIHKSSDSGITFVRSKPYDIPFRCLLPLKIDNLLVAGRCISTTHEAHASTRVIATCMATGQAAGTAAALAVRDKLPPKRLNISLLQKAMIEQGCWLNL